MCIFLVLSCPNAFRDQWMMSHDLLQKRKGYHLDNHDSFTNYGLRFDGDPLSAKSTE
jgi:hypothetical protein